MADDGRIRHKGLRRSKLIVPGDQWEMVSKAHRSAADIVHIDLEDGVSPRNRASAVEIVLRALDELDWSRKEAWIRVDHFIEDGVAETVDTVVRGQPNLIYMAKTQTPQDMEKLDEIVTASEQKWGVPAGSIEIGAVIERIRGLHNVEAIAAATPRIGAIIFGVADMANEYGYRQSGIAGGDFETLYARSRMILAARLAGIDVIDAPYMHYRDVENSEIDANFSARLGFTGKSAISPRQIEGINRAFSPTEQEIAWAREVMKHAQALETDGVAIATVDGEMIDKPHFIKAKRIMAQVG